MIGLRTCSYERRLILEKKKPTCLIIGYLLYEINNNALLFQHKNNKKKRIKLKFKFYF